MRENLADFDENHSQSLDNNCLDGPIAGHVLTRISRFGKNLCEIGKGFLQPLEQICVVNVGNMHEIYTFEGRGGRLHPATSLGITY